MEILLHNFGKIMLMVLSTFMAAQLHAAGESQIPSKGLTQEQVKQHFGEPNFIGATVGQPPITRWDYEHYTVVFEGNYVIHSFMHKKLKAIHLNPKPQISKPEPAPETESKVEEILVEEIPTPEAVEETVVETAEQTVVETTDEKADDVVEEAEVAETAEEVVEESTDEKVDEVIEEAEAVESTEEVIEEVTEPEAPAEETIMEEITPPNAEQPTEAKDLNYEEAPQDAEFGKWGY